MLIISIKYLIISDHYVFDNLIFLGKFTVNNNYNLIIYRILS